MIAALEACGSPQKLDKGLLNGVTTSNAGQAALRPLDSGLRLDKLQKVRCASATVRASLLSFLEWDCCCPIAAACLTPRFVSPATGALRLGFRGCHRRRPGVARLEAEDRP